MRSPSRAPSHLLDRRLDRPRLDARVGQGLVAEQPRDLAHQLRGTAAASVVSSRSSASLCRIAGCDETWRVGNSLADSLIAADCRRAARRADRAPTATIAEDVPDTDSADRKADCPPRRTSRALPQGSRRAGARRSSSRTDRGEPAPRPRRAGQRAGEVEWGIGDPDVLVSLRSAVKPFGVAALVEAGGIEAFNLTEPEMAVMAASHTGEDAHVRTVQAVLRRAGPQPVAAGMRHRGCAARHVDRRPARARRRDAQPDPPHVLRLPHVQPAAVATQGLVAARLLAPRTPQPGCRPRRRFARSSTPSRPRWSRPSTPVACRPTRSRWRRSRAAFALLAAPDGAPRAAQARSPRRLTRVRDAMVAAPDMVGGTRESSDTSSCAPGRQMLVVKGGAEGLRGIGLFAGARGEGSAAAGIAVKIEDGDLTGRANKVASIEALAPAAASSTRPPSSGSTLLHRPPLRDPRRRRDRPGSPDFPAGADFRAGLTAPMAQPFDPYRALGVRRDATEAEIKAAHRKLAKRFHPDADGGDRERFLKVQEAYQRPVRCAAAPRVGRQARSRADQRRRASPTPAPPERELRAGRSGRRSRSIPSQQTRGPRRPTSRRRAGRAARAPTRGPRPRCRGGKRASAGTSASRASAGRPLAKAAPEPPPAADRARRRTRRTHSTSTTARAARRGPWPRAPTSGAATRTCRGAARGSTRERRCSPGRGREPTQRPRPSAAPPPLARSRRRRWPAPAAAAAPQPLARPRTDPPSRTRPPRRAWPTTPTRSTKCDKSWQRRTNAASWPSLKERLLYALMAWIPAGLVIGYGGAAATGCDGTIVELSAHGRDDPGGRDSARARACWSPFQRSPMWARWRQSVACSSASSSSASCPSPA